MKVQGLGKIMNMAMKSMAELVAKAVIKILEEEYPNLFRKDKEWFSLDLSTIPWRAVGLDGRRFESSNYGKTWEEQF